MASYLVTAADFNPIELGETKERLRITNDEEDAMLLSMIRSATLYAENIINWRLCTQTWNKLMDTWPYGGVIKLPFPPVQSVTHIKYYDDSNVQQTISAATYEVDIYSKPAIIRPVNLNYWPSHYYKLNAIEIQYVCGFASADLIPQDIKDAIYLRVADLYENRQDTWVSNGALTISRNTITSENILNHYKLYNEPCI